MTTAKLIEALTLTCTRCGHQWLRRSPVKHPKVCAACNSPYWNRPRQLAYAIEAAKTKERAQ